MYTTSCSKNIVLFCSLYYKLLREYYVVFGVYSTSSRTNSVLYLKCMLQAVGLHNFVNENRKGNYRINVISFHIGVMKPQFFKKLMFNVTCFLKKKINLFIIASYRTEAFI
jgi:hypothetical protein